MRSGNFPGFLKMSGIFEKGVRAYYGGTAGTRSGPLPVLTQAPNGTQNLDKKYPRGTHRF
jgi:hypothetical protein